MLFIHCQRPRACLMWKETIHWPYSFANAGDQAVLIQYYSKAALANVLKHTESKNPGRE